MMWEQWRAEIDAASRDAELARDKWYEHGFRSELRRDPLSVLSRFRLFDRSRATPAVRREEILPPSWRLRDAWVRRPVL